MINELKTKIEEYFENLEKTISSEVINDIDHVIELLEAGKIRVSEKINGIWSTNTWVKKAILLAFKLKPAKKQDFDSFDKFGLLNYDYSSHRYRKVPVALIRKGVFIGDDAIIMPSYINIGAYVGTKTMIDINASIGSCAQIGNNCHISASACIGGVLEPLVANPVIIEDNCFIGVHSSILEGVIVQEGAVIASGVSISASTKIIDRQTGNITYGTIPPHSVVVSGSYPSNGVNISCAVIVKQVDARTKSKSSINELLRD